MGTLQFGKESYNWQYYENHYSVPSDYEYMQPVRSKIISGCPISGPKVSISVKVSDMQTGNYEYVQPVRL